MNDNHHSPGRPSKKEKRDVVGRLLTAAEKCLSEKTFQEITIAELANAADTTEGMISYYFGSKNGLFIALMDESMKYSAAKLKDLSENIQSMPGNPTKNLVDCMLKLTKMRPGAAKLTLSERHRNDSVFKDLYNNYGNSFSEIVNVISALKEANSYSTSLNARYAALILMSVITISHQWGQVLDGFGFTHEELESDEWIDFVTDVFDRKFRDKN